MSARVGGATANAASIQNEAYRAMVDAQLREMPKPIYSPDKFMARLERRVEEIELLNGTMPAEEVARWRKEASAFSG